MAGELFDGLGHCDGAAREVDISDAQGDDLLPGETEHPGGQYKGLVVAGQLADELVDLPGGEGPSLGSDDPREGHLPCW
jgi:hypothetical protein